MCRQCRHNGLIDGRICCLGGQVESGLDLEVVALPLATRWRSHRAAGLRYAEIVRSTAQVSLAYATANEAGLRLI